MDKFTLMLENLDDYKIINKLHYQIFGASLYTRASHLIREEGKPNLKLSYVLRYENKLIGSLRITDICIGNTPAVLLGPMVIEKNYQNKGLGTRLIQKVLSNIDTKHLAGNLMAEVIFLIGDYNYYKKFGFENFDINKIKLPAPALENRCLIRPIGQSIVPLLEGKIYAR